MFWGAKIKAAFHGDVDGADVVALLHASRVLATMRQDLDSRRLDLQLAHAAPDTPPTSAVEEWRVAADVGEVATRLWLAENLVSLAQSLFDAEAEAHPETPGVMSAMAHGVALALLQPVESIVAEVSAALVDPTRPLTLPLPLSVLPRGEGASGSPSSLGPVPPASFVRGLQRGAEHLEATTQVILEEFATMIGRSGAPSWMGAAVQRLRGEMAAAQTRLEMVRARCAPLLAHQALDDRTVQQVMTDLWLVIDTYLRIGQMVAAPRLLPGARPLPPRSVGHATAPEHTNEPSQGPGLNPRKAPRPPVITPSADPAPPSPPLATGPSWPTASPLDQTRPLPTIEPTWQPAARNATAPPIESPPSVPSNGPTWREPLDKGRSLPEIPGITHSIPADHPPEKEDGATPSATPVNPAAPRAMPEIASPHHAAPAATRQLPEIGASAQLAETNNTPEATGNAGSGTAPAGDRHVGYAERWLLSSPTSRHRLRASGQEEQAERDLTAFWESRHWTLSGREAAYLDEVAALVDSGAVAGSGRSLSNCPFAPIYRVMRNPIHLQDHMLSANSLFTFDYRAGHQTLRIGLNPGDGVDDAE